MIYKLTIKDPNQTPVPWFGKVEAFAKPRSFEFKPGLNILWGRNGTGKTTLTKLLARFFHCEQGNRSVVTQDSLNTLVGGGLNDFDIAKAVQVEHDGQNVRHFDPGHAVGLMGGMAAFDWDFGHEGMMNATFKGSAGQTTMYRFDNLLTEIIAGIVPKIEWMMKRSEVNSLWEKRIDRAAALLKANAKKGPPTFLLDEPERSYDLNAQAGLWRMLRAYSDEVQLIVASHSLFALNLPEAHYIDLSPGYLATSKAALALLGGGWAAEKPSKVPVAKVAKLRKQLEERNKKR